MKPSDVQRTVRFFIRMRKPILLVGRPGIGKTDIGIAAAAAEGYDVLVFHPVVDEPTDYKGLPANVNGLAEFLPYGNLRRILEATKPTVVFLDDVGQAPDSVQAALMQLLLAREINGQKVPDCVTFIAATNRREDKAGVRGILEPVKSRFATIIELDVDVNDWSQWAIENDQPAELIAFVRFRPNFIQEFNPTKDMTNSPCPRTIAAVGKMINDGLFDEFPEYAIRHEIIKGAVGETFAAEFIGFLKIYETLPNVDDIFADPDAVDAPTDPAVMYAVSGVLSHRVERKTFANAIKYMEKIGAEFQALFMNEVKIKHPELIETAAYRDWTIQNSEVALI